jgi:hypothetical protein
MRFLVCSLYFVFDLSQMHVQVGYSVADVVSKPVLGFLVYRIVKVHRPDKRLIELICVRMHMHIYVHDHHLT